MESTHTVLLNLFVTRKFLTDESMMSCFGPFPAGLGVPLSARVASLATLKIEIESAWELELMAYRNFLDGSNAMPVGEVFCTCGVSAPRVMAPVAPLMCSRSTEPRAGKVT